MGIGRVTVWPIYKRISVQCYVPLRPPSRGFRVSCLAPTPHTLDFRVYIYVYGASCV